ncbi:hypothetical protein Anas_07733 [Armadillidium nasatum]|uniref:Neuropeptide-like protein 31 n=1 Tax=Armadillidium nasatum TaxID=96803 RepID=A0A5N5SYH0_9CRUS|nr:hypothetical protein Anas_07733 [Armadillidium nasatum]
MKFVSALLFVFVCVASLMSFTKAAPDADPEAEPWRSYGYGGYGGGYRRGYGGYGYGRFGGYGGGGYGGYGGYGGFRRGYGGYW